MSGAPKPTFENTYKRRVCLNTGKANRKEELGYSGV